MKNHDGWFRTVGVICVAAMAMSLVMFVIPGNVGMGAESPPTSFEISLDFPELEITDNGDGTDTLHLEGYPCSMDVGLPAIPSKTLSISVPPGMRADSLEVTRSDWKALPGAHAIRWGQPPAPSTEDFNPLPAPAPADQEVYGSDSPYPDQPVSLDGTGMMRKYSMARVKVTPVRYRPHSGTLEASGSMSIRVDCVPGRELEPKELADDSLEGVQSSIIDNFDQASSWYRPEGARSPLPQADTADYVIITTDALSTAADPLKNYKISQGLSVVTVTTSWLNTTYPLEPDLPARIRKYLKDNYVAYGIDYVLIVGNDSLVNMRRCYTPVEQGAAYDYTPTDYYYSDLSGDWDISRDGKYGQYGVDDIAGGVDFYPEVYVGRIPNDNAVEITSICNKIVNFQTDSGAWKKKALLLGATSNYANEDYSGYGATWGSTLMEEMKSGLLDPGGYTYTTMYEKAGRTPEPPACDMNLTNANVVSEWPKDYGLVNWWAHGSETAAWRKYWSTDDGDGVPESGEMSWPSLVTSADAASMDDAHPSVVFSCSCNTAWPENANSMDKAFMKQGASAFVGASRISWYRVGWANKDGGGNASIDYFFYKSLLEGNSAGKALRDSDLQYRNNYWFGGWDDCHHANLCGFNLYGDPSMTLNQPTNHTVTASVSGGHGTVSPPSQSVSYGGTATININPDTGYHIAGITDNGSPATIANPYVIKNVTANHTVVVTFAPAGLCTVTASVSGGHGTVSPPSQSVSYGGTATININPDTGYHIAGITDNGSPATIANPYVIKNVTANHTVVVSLAVSEGSTWYLAEGSTDWGYDCYITIENPNNESVSATVTYMTDAGALPGGDIDMPAMSQATINPRDILGAKDFSTKVECKQGKTIAVDRTMSWTGEGAPSPDGHCSIGVTSPNKTWYLAEGSSAWGFECWLLIQNPNATEATAQVTYMIEGDSPQTFEKKIPANSRKTYNMANDIGEKDASIKVEADISVIPERAMYRNNRRSGHDSIGTTSPAENYYLAEGTTDWGFTTYVLVQNPNPGDTEVTVTYMTSSGAVPQAPFTMPANSRHTIRVNDALPASDFSTQVSGSQPIIAERAMYWGEGTAAGEACHDSIGLAAPHTTFYLPDGETSNGRETYTLVQNPNASDVTVEITYMTPDSKGNVTKTEKIPASSRKTFNMLEHSGITGRASIMVTSKTAGKKIMVERAMYWNNRGAGTDTIGGYGD